MQCKMYIFFLIRHFSASVNNFKLRLNEEVYEVHFMFRKPLEQVHWQIQYEV